MFLTKGNYFPLSLMMEYYLQNSIKVAAKKKGTELFISVPIEKKMKGPTQYLESERICYEQFELKKNCINYANSVKLNKITAITTNEK